MNFFKNTPEQTVGKKRDGFSLIEIVLALMVMAVGIMALLGVFPTALQFSRMSHEQTRLAHAADTIFNAMETELRMDPRLWQRGWGGTTTRHWPCGTAQAVSNTVFRPDLGADAGYGNYYNWHLHEFNTWHQESGFGIWEEEQTAIQAIVTDEASNFWGHAYNEWFTSTLTSQHANNLIDVGYRYLLTLSDASYEFRTNPEGWTLYTMAEEAGWPSDHPDTPGELPPPAGEGLPPYANIFHGVLQHMDGRDGGVEYRISQRVYIANLVMAPGLYGVTRPDNQQWATDTGRGGRNHSIVERRHHAEFRRMFSDLNNGYDRYLRVQN